MKVGDRVEWESGAGMGWTKKVGRIVQVVPAKELPKEGFFLSTHKFMYGYGRGSDIGIPRNHESYLVEVPPNGKATKRPAKPKLYWPRVSQLRKVED